MTHEAQGPGRGRDEGMTRRFPTATTRNFQFCNRHHDAARSRVQDARQELPSRRYAGRDVSRALSSLGRILYVGETEISASLTGLDSGEILVAGSVWRVAGWLAVERHPGARTRESCVGHVACGES